MHASEAGRTLVAGAELGPYRIVSLLGTGGMGEVYVARDTRLRRDVALKVLPAAYASDSERLDRFRQEALAVAALSHPNIVAVHDIGTLGEVPYMVMELLEGETLRQRLARGPVLVAQATAYARQLAHGLAAAHDKGIVHRDIKPENVFITKDGHVKILDFGLAKLREAQAGDTVAADAPSTHALTAPQTLLGTVGYMSPEQVRGLPADHRSDLFSFGTVLFEMLSGRRAFGAASVAESMSAILRDEPPVETAVHAPAVSAVIRRCLEKRPDQRFQSAADLAFALELSRLDDSRPTARPVLPSRERRFWVAAAGLLALAVVLLAAALASVRQSTVPHASIRMAIAQPGTVSFIIGSGIVEAMKQSSPDWDVEPVVTEGAVEAVRRVDQGEAEFALASNLLAFHAVNTDRLLGHRSSRIAGVTTLFETPTQILVRSDAGIRSLEDLRARRVSVGPAASGERIQAEVLLSHFGVKRGEFTERFLDIEDGIAALADGSIDAYVAARGLPHPQIAQAMETGRVRLLSLDPDSLAGLRLNQPFLVPFTIPKGTYPRQVAAVQTVAPKILFVASRSLSNTVIDRALTSLAAHQPQLIAKHPAATEINLKKRPTVADGMSIELHPGAVQFFERAERQ